MVAASWAISRARQHAFFGLGRRQFEEHEHQPGHGIAQGVAVAALECRAGQDRAFTGLGGGLQLFTKADQPAGTVAVVQRDASAHLADVFGRVESVAFDQAAAASGSDGSADAAFAATGHAHDDEAGGNRVQSHLVARSNESERNGPGNRTVCGCRVHSGIALNCVMIRANPDAGSGMVALS